MQKFAAGQAAAPDLNRTPAFPDGRIDLGEQGRQDMAREQVEIVVGAIEVRRHHRGEITAMLAAISLAQFEPGDFGDRIPLVGRLERAGQQAAFRHRPRSAGNSGGRPRHGAASRGRPRRRRARPDRARDAPSRSLSRSRRGLAAAASATSPRHNRR